jgi:hypothetical protein
VEPVIPISISADWNVISRTIAPVIWLEDVQPGRDEFGLGNLTQSFFLSPKQPTESGWIWGAGSVLRIPTGTDDLTTGETWGLGPTGVALRQDGPFTFGLLFNHVWSIAGDSDRPDVNATYLQPFLACTTRDAWTFTLDSESTYDWEAEEWTIPLNAIVSKIVRIGKLPVSLGVGARYWADSPSGGPEGWGARVVVTVLLPK